MPGTDAHTQRSVVWQGGCGRGGAAGGWCGHGLAPQAVQGVVLRGPPPQPSPTHPAPHPHLLLALPEDVQHEAGAYGQQALDGAVPLHRHRDPGGAEGGLRHPAGQAGARGVAVAGAEHAQRAHHAPQRQGRAGGAKLRLAELGGRDLLPALEGLADLLGQVGAAFLTQLRSGAGVGGWPGGRVGRVGTGGGGGSRGVGGSQEMRFLGGRLLAGTQGASSVGEGTMAGHQRPETQIQMARRLSKDKQKAGEQPMAASPAAHPCRCCSIPAPHPTPTHPTPPPQPPTPPPPTPHVQRLLRGFELAADGVKCKLEASILEPPLDQVHRLTAPAKAALARQRSHRLRRHRHRRHRLRSRRLRSHKQLEQGA